MTIIGISGSLRARSFNTMLLRAAVAGRSIETASIADIPLYDGDVEAAGIPPVVAALKDRVAGAKGLLMVTPEYNGSIPGVLKNAIDWLSRPTADIPRVFGGLVVGVIGASPGPYGTALAQNAWAGVLRRLNTVPFFGATLQVASADKVFDADGNIVDAGVAGRLDKYIQAFAAFVERHGR